MSYFCSPLCMEKWPRTNIIWAGLQLDLKLSCSDIIHCCCFSILWFAALPYSPSQCFKVSRWAPPCGSYKGWYQDSALCPTQQVPDSRAWASLLQALSMHPIQQASILCVSCSLLSLASLQKGACFIVPDCALTIVSSPYDIMCGADEHGLGGGANVPNLNLWLWSSFEASWANKPKVPQPSFGWLARYLFFRRHLEEDQRPDCCYLSFPFIFFFLVHF